MVGDREKAFANRCKSFDFCVNLSDLGVGDRAHGATNALGIDAQGKQFPNFIEAEPKFLSTLDEANAAGALCGIDAVAGWKPSGFWEKFLPFVVANRLEVDPHFVRELSNL